MPQTNSPYQYLAFKENEPYRRYIQRDNEQNNSNPIIGKEQHPPTATHGSYGALLFHPNWKAKRKEILARDQQRCVHCKSGKELQVHHRQYHFDVLQQKFRLPWDYPDRLLITLCGSCHSRGHNKFKVPTINI